MIKCTKTSLGEIVVYRYEDDSLMLHNDLYQINMAESYWNDGIHPATPTLARSYSTAELLLQNETG